MTFTDHGITVTIKYGKAYDHTWAVFKGQTVEEVRQLVLDYFGVNVEAVEELSTHELVVNLTNVAQGGSTAATMLGAVAIPQIQPKPERTDNPWAGLEDEKPGEFPVESAAPAAPEHEFQYVLDKFAAANDIKELQKVWAANQPAFSNEDVVVAYKARGKELTK